MVGIGKFNPLRALRHRLLRKRLSVLMPRRRFPMFRMMLRLRRVLNLPKLSELPAMQALSGTSIMFRRPARFVASSDA